MTQTPGKTWYVAAYAALIPVTVGATVLLVALNLDVGQSKWPDAQPEDQMVAKWRTAAVLAYTSGSAVGHVCALVAGLLAAQCAAMAVVFATLLIVAGVGFGVAQVRPVYKALLIVAALALIPVAHVWIPAVVLISGVGPY
ncbi:hypothetical protein ACFYUK_33395 [Nonomuraea wenchangensis]